MGRTTVESQESGCASPWASYPQECNVFWHSRNESRGPACHSGSIKSVRYECLRGESRHHALRLRMRDEVRRGWGRWRHVPTFRTRQLSHYGQVSSLWSPTAQEMTDSWPNVVVGIRRRRLQPVVAAPGSFHSRTDGREVSGMDVVG